MCALALNAVGYSFPVPGAVKGTVTGMVFTTCTLPLTNYRYCKSMGLPVDSNALFKVWTIPIYLDKCE